MPAPTDIARLQDYLQRELDGAALYDGLAAASRDEAAAATYRHMAADERRHAALWQSRLTDAGATIPPFRLSWRTRTLIWLAGRFGAAAVAPTVAAQEMADSRTYARSLSPADEALAADERAHAATMRQMAGMDAASEPRPGMGPVRGSGTGPAAIHARMEGRHGGAGGNALRAAVLGANDGLVSNLSLVMGVTGAEMAPGAILLTGLAGLLAGAGSMALGEWLSVQSSRELYQRQLALEREEIEAAPEAEAAELASIYESRGMDAAQAQAMAARVMADKDTAVQVMAREELGIDPESLGGSAWEAAGTSFVLFAAGAIIPVLPFMFWTGATAIVASAAASALGLFAIGGGITLFTGRSVLFSGTRQVVFGLAAAALTFGIGRLIGVSLAG